MKEWYDGYRFGNVDVYCPWDVINFCSDHLADPGLEPKNYWANTSGNSVISHFELTVWETTEADQNGTGTAGKWRDCPERN